jgi:hypothetical protein
MAPGDRVACVDIEGNTAANGLWVVRQLTPTTCELTGSTGNGRLHSRRQLLRASGRQRTGLEHQRDTRQFAVYRFGDHRKQVHGWRDSRSPLQHVQ